MADAPAIAMPERTVPTTAPRSRSARNTAT